MNRGRLPALALLVSLALAVPAYAWPPYSCYRPSASSPSVSYYAPLLAPAAVIPERRPFVAPTYNSYYAPYGSAPAYRSYSPYIAAYATTLPPTPIGVPLRSFTYTGYYPPYYPPGYSGYYTSAYGGPAVRTGGYYLPGESYFTPSYSLTPGFNRVFLTTGDFQY
jgi:hypothetical protein